MTARGKAAVTPFDAAEFLDNDVVIAAYLNGWGSPGMD